MEQKPFSSFLKGVSIEKVKQTFLEGESPTLRNNSEGPNYFGNKAITFYWFIFFQKCGE